MTALEDQGLAGWLGLTNQQYEILKVVLELRREKQRASPKAIVDRYAAVYGRRIQKSNLFTQIGFLVDNDLLVKEEKANYAVNFEGITHRLSETRERLLNNFEEFEKVASEAERHLLNIGSEPAKPVVKYMDYDGVYDFLNKRVRYAKGYLSITLFPSVLLFPTPRAGEKRAEWLETLTKRCFQKKELRAIYITQLNIGHIFRTMVNATDDSAGAYRNCKAVIAQFEDYVTKHENLEIRYIKGPYGFDFSMPITDENNIDEFFVFIRDNTEEIVGGIYIKSQETARAIHSRFLAEYETTERIDKSNVKKWAKKLEVALDHEYNLYVDRSKKNMIKEPTP